MKRMSRWPSGLTLLALAACGGSDPAPGLTDAQRTQAASATAQGAGNAGATVAPFSWKIGDRPARLASGAVGGASVSATSLLAIASASKWLYAAQVAERRAGVLTPDDVRFLNFRSGYDSFLLCLPGQTVDACLASPAVNGAFSAADVGRFFYNGGHNQQPA